MTESQSGPEERFFKPAPGGYVFQLNSPWLFGPSRRFLVDEAQKTEIAACFRRNRRTSLMLLIVLLALMSLASAAGIFWLSTHGSMLKVTITSVDGASTSYSQSIGANGADGVLTGAAGATVHFHVSGPPGEGATLTVTPFDAAGKAGGAAVTPFRPGAAKINLNDEKGRLVSSAILATEVGATPNVISLCNAIILIAIGVSVLALMNGYAWAKLHPLIAGLPRTDLRITFMERMRNSAKAISPKALPPIYVVILCAIGVIVMDASRLAGFLGGASSDDSVSFAMSLIISAYLFAYFVTLMVLRAKAKREEAQRNEPRGQTLE